MNHLAFHAGAAIFTTGRFSDPPAAARGARERATSGTGTNHRKASARAADFKPPLTKSGQTCGQYKRLGKRCRWHLTTAQTARSRARARDATAARKASFLEAYAKVPPPITHACRVAGVGRRTHYDWLEADPEYAERFEDARAEAVDEVEFAMRRIALGGGDHVPSSVRAQQTLLRANLPGAVW